ncbi:MULTISPECIES: hypothetical protein [Rickettsieae]|uniref:hypothetical protein n=1 Tax=Rickettsieae TaxID=33988 RepID=UPI0012FF8E1D|nr:hypothetical protein [Rickettsia endosymbiont of Culicoides newsteadi]
MTLRLNTNQIYNVTNFSSIDYNRYFCSTNSCIHYFCDIAYFYPELRLDYEK